MELNQNTKDPYPTPKQTGINYCDNIPSVWDVDKWYVGQYCSSSTWPPPWGLGRESVLYDREARGKPQGTTGDFSWGARPDWMSQNVMVPTDGISPIYYMLAGLGIYKYIYR